MLLLHPQATESAGLFQYVIVCMHATGAQLAVYSATFDKLLADIAKVATVWRLFDAAGLLALSVVVAMHTSW